MSRFIACGITALGLSTAAWAGLPDYSIVVREGDMPLGGDGTGIEAINDPTTNSLGQLSFNGKLVSGDRYVWFDGQITFLGSSALPDVIGQGSRRMGVSDSGEFIQSVLYNGVGAVWSNNGLIIAADDLAPGTDGQFISFAASVSMQPDGTAHWLSGFTSTQGGITQGHALYESTGAGTGPPTMLLRTGDIVDGYTIGAPWGVDWDYKISDNGDHHIHILDTTELDRFVYIDGDMVHREGFPTGDGDNWRVFEYVSINNDGNYIHTGRTDGDNDSDEYLAYNGNIIVREGDVLAGVELTSPASVRSVALNNDGLVAVLWDKIGAVETIFVGEADNFLATAQVLIRTQAPIDTGEGNTVELHIVNDLNATSSSGPGSLDLPDSDYMFIEANLIALGGEAEFEAIVKVEFPSSCPADLNEDGTVDAADLAILLGAWGPNPDHPADCNNNGIVDAGDLAGLLGSWGACP